MSFSTVKKGYNPEEVNAFIIQKDEELKRAFAEIEDLKTQVEALQTTAEKADLYDKLMEKMQGDYANLLTPAITKAKTIEAEAEAKCKALEAELNARLDQAKRDGDGVVDASGDKIAAVVQNNMDKMYALLDAYAHSKTLLGRVESLFGVAKLAVEKMVESTAGLRSSVKDKLETYAGSIKDMAETAIEELK